MREGWVIHEAVYFWHSAFRSTCRPCRASECGPHLDPGSRNRWGLGAVFLPHIRRSFHSQPRRRQLGELRVDRRLDPYPEYPPGTNTTPFPFVSQIYAWAGTVTNGTPLFTSSVQYITTDLVPYTFTPNVAVIPGQQYVALVTNSPMGISLGGGGPTESSYRIGWMFFTGDSYPGTYFADIVGNPEGTQGWQIFDGNAAFTANFVSTP